MSASVEFAPELHRGERYGHSLASIRAMGDAALKGAGFETLPIVAHNYDDFVTAVTENIATDDEFGESLVIGTPKVREIVDGKVTALNGQPVIELVKTGAEFSRAMAEKDSSYVPQKIRDEGDELFTELVDSLQIGEVAHAVSMDPKEQMALNPKKWESAGYRKGMAVQHVAYRLNESTMLMWTYIIKQSDKSAVAQIYRENYGIDIDPDTHSDIWIRNIHRSHATLDEVEQIGRHTLERHKEIIGSRTKHYSATEFIAQNVDTLQEYFDNYVIPLSKATVLKENNTVLQELAKTILQSVDNLKPEVQHGLIRVANSRKFNDENARLMQAMIRYAVVEDLRKKLPEFMGRADKLALQNKTEIVPHRILATYFYNPAQAYVAQRSVHEMNSIMALNINEGVAAKRSLGGCSGVQISNDDSGMPGIFNDIFGRVDRVDNEISVIMGKDGKGPLKFKCTKGHENEREDGKPLLTHCKKCGENVSCGTEEKKSEMPKKSTIISLFKNVGNRESAARKAA